jgi:hypothetical protein
LMIATSPRGSSWMFFIVDIQKKQLCLAIKSYQ